MIYKVLGQTTSGLLFRAPDETVVSLISVCNRSSSSNTYTVTVNGTPLFSNQTIPGNDTHFLNLGITLQAGDTISVNGSNISFNAYGTEVWNPTALFSLGEAGAWYDPSDVTTLFSDAAGTVPAVVDGSVGCMLDKSGNSNHATQTSTGAKPTLKFADGRYFLYFDGIDDWLVLNSGFSPATGQTWSAAFGANLLVPKENNAAQIISPTFGATDEGLRFNLSKFLTATRNFGTSNATINTLRINGQIAVFEEEFSEGNNVFYGSVDIAATSANQHEIGRNVNDTNHFEGNFIGGVFVSRNLSTVEIDRVERYLAAKAGVQL